jgi:outer membrane biosynthesis protein TonB
MGIQARVYVSFIIGKDGKVIMVKPRDPYKNLEK